MGSTAPHPVGRNHCKLLLNYAENAVGAWMVANITTLPDDCTVEDAISRLKAEHAVVKSDVVHVVDRERRLQGLVNVVNLLRNSSNSPITRTALISAANHTAWAHQDMIAVTNRNNQMVGVLRHVDLRKGLENLASTITKSSGSDPLTGIYEVYGSSLLALFRTISEAAGANRA